MALLFLASVCIGNFKFGQSYQKPVDDISLYAGQEISLQGLIVDDPQIDGNLIKFTILVKGIENSDAKTSGKILVKTRKYPNYNYGNPISLNGLLKKPYDSDEFSYSNYLSRFGIYSTMDYPNISIIEPFSGNWFLASLYKLKNSCLSIINKILPEPTAAFLAGLLFGVRQNMPDDLLNNFKITGLTHIIALSGFNITIIAGALMSWLRFVPARARFVFTVLAIISFVLLTGASPSVTRAAIMGILILLAGSLGKISDITISLLLAAVVMLWVNPKILAFDIGFQLSFLSTLGIVYLHPLLSPRLPNFFTALKEYLSPTLSALIFVTPIIVYNFSSISLIAPISNILVLPLIPASMGLGFLATVVGFINLSLGSWLGWIAWIPLKIIISITNCLAKLPLASLDININSPHWVIIYYLIIGSITIYLYVHKKPNLPSRA